MTQTNRAFGLSDPSLAVGLSTVAFYSSAIPFINVFKQIGDVQRIEGAWTFEVTDENGNTERLDYSELARAGFLDENGYILRLPEGSESILSLFNNIPADANIGGRYVFRYQGDGDFRLFGGNVVEELSVPGRLVIDINNEGFPVGIVINDVNENNHLRDFVLVREEHEALHDAGAIFNPDYLEEIEDFRVLRFMDWMHTNNSNVREFSDLADVDDAFYGLPSNQALEYEIAGLIPSISPSELATLSRGFNTPVYLDPDTREPLRDADTGELVTFIERGASFIDGLQTGVPLEIMVALSNQVGADPWFNIPHQASDDFVRQFATFIRDNLDPRLNVYVEYSNEVWNAQFDQFHYVNEEGLRFFGERSAAGDNFGDQFGDFPAVAYYGYRSAEIISIFHEVFADQSDRINGVLSGQTFNPFVAQTAIQGAEYYFELNAPDVALDDIIDSLGVTGYFGGNVISQSNIGESIVRLVEASQEAFRNGETSSEFELANRELAEYYRSGTLFTGAPDSLAQELHFTLPDVQERFELHAGLIRGERLFNAPAGQAYDIDLVQYEGGPTVIPVTNEPVLREFLLQFNRSEELGTVLGEALELFRGVGGTLANDFFAVGVPSFGTNFGTQMFLGDENAQSRAFADYNENAAQQFGQVQPGRDGAAFLQGITQLGTNASETLFGTNEEDFLAAGLGNDAVNGGAGDDGLNGEAGNDTLNGGAGNDTLVGEAGNDRIDGGAGNDFALSGDGNDLLIGNTGDDDLRSGRDNDTIRGGAGNDLLVSQAGNDSLSGGDGNDFLTSGAMADTLNGGGNRDTLNGGAGDDLLFGGTDIDMLNGGAGNDRLFGNTGNDLIAGGSGNDFADGGIGNDVLSLSSGNDTLNGNRGDDTLNAGVGDDLIDGGDGNDEINAASGRDTIFGGNGNDAIASGDDADFVAAGTGNDTVNAGNSNDTVFGNQGNDFIAGRVGDDLLSGQDGNDTVNGGSGNDTINGGAGNDLLVGETGNDVINGGNGNDFIVGGGGDDVLSGGPGGVDRFRGGEGADTFIFANGFGVDVIEDFNADEIGERIDLSAVGAITSFSDLINNHVSTDSSGNTVIAAGANRLVLVDVAIGDLSADDFLF
ncbi:MAG: calcium-binding protein [Pseudomonadota bacterium]